MRHLSVGKCEICPLRVYEQDKIFGDMYFRCYLVGMALNEEDLSQQFPTWCPLEKASEGEKE